MLSEFKMNHIHILTQTVWDTNKEDDYASVEDFKKCTGQDIGYSIEQDTLRFCKGTVYKICDEDEKLNIVLAHRCGFGVFEYIKSFNASELTVQKYLFKKSPIPENDMLGIMAYQALRYQKINSGFVRNLSNKSSRRNTEFKMGKELYLKVIMSLGIVNDIDYEDSLT